MLAQTIATTRNSLGFAILADIVVREVFALIFHKVNFDQICISKFAEIHV